MYKDILSDLEYMKKTASEEDYEALCQSIAKDMDKTEVLANISSMASEFEKEASLLGSAAKGIAKGSVNWIKKAPIKRTVALATGAMTAKGLGDTAKGELAKSPTAFAPKTFGMPNMHQKPQMFQPGSPFAKSAYEMDNNFNTIEENEKEDMGAMKYLPWAAAALPVGLAVGYRLKTGKNLMPTREGMQKAMGNIAKGGGFGRTVKNMAGAVNVAGQTVKDNTQRAADALFKGKGDPSVLFSDEAKEAVREAVEKELKGMGSQGRADFINSAIDDETIKDALDRHLNKAHKAFNQEAIDRSINKSVEDIKNQNSIAHKMLQGVGLGVGTATSTFAVQAIGDEYFKRKDQDEMRALIRDQRSEKGDPEYRTPRQTMLGIPRFMRKQAALDKSLMKEILRDDIIGNAKNSLISAAVPGLASLAINRNIRKDFKKINDEKAQRALNTTTIDVPLADLEKRATLNLDRMKLSESAKKKIKEGAIDNARVAIRALSGAAAPAAVAAITGRNIRSNFERLEEAKRTPIQSGNARVTIETEPGVDLPKLGFGKSAVELEDLQKEIKKKLEPEDTKEKMNKRVRQMNTNIREKSYQWTMLK